MEAAVPSEIFVTSKLHIPDHRVLNIHRRENMKPHLSPGTKDIHTGTKIHTAFRREHRLSLAGQMR